MGIFAQSWCEVPCWSRTVLSKQPYGRLRLYSTLPFQKHIVFVTFEMAGLNNSRRTIDSPEALLPRSDSRDPARTCAGMTQSGRRCRRPLAMSPTSQSRRGSAPAGVTDAAAMYCHQHKDQAPNMATVPERRSEDTLIARLSGLDLGPDAPKPRPPRPARPAQEVKYPSLCSMLCCSSGSATQDEPLEVVRRRRPRPAATSASAAQPSPRPEMNQRPLPFKAHSSGSAPLTSLGVSSNAASTKRLIPPRTSPEVTALLMAELSKPLSPNDESGYIYMFWLTGASPGAPQDRDAAALLAESHGQQLPGTRDADTLLRSFSTAGTTRSDSKVLLKIGRANNVHRRMQQWQKQCGHDVSLIRFYPHTSRSATPPEPKHRRQSAGTSPAGELSQGVRKVPYSHRVERLIHIELSPIRAKLQACETCGREHREWFAADATRVGVRRIDSVIQHWITWAEGLDK